MAQKTASATPSGEQSGSATPSPADHRDTVAAAHPTSAPTSNGISTALTDADAAPATSTSQPMSKSASSSSDPTAKDLSADTASPYGTRSRNRNGSSRPNYAEDKDIDVEMFDYPSEKKDPEPKKSSRFTSANSAQESLRSNGSSRKAASADEGRTSLPNHASRDPTSSIAASGTMHAAQPGTAPQSKKRKAATQASSASASQSHTPAPSAVVTVGGTRRAAAASNATNVFAESNMLTFETCRGRLKDGALVADDGTVLSPNDNVYLVCEPPGEPYYLGRIMEFLHAQNDHGKPIDALRINWFYRPKDIGKKVNDTRLVFATMHSDISPLTSLRGKCQIKHKAEISSMDTYRKTPDCFWYEKLYDRYIQKNYDLIPTSQIVNVPEKVKKVLDERWKFIIVEQGRGKEFTSAVKLCKRCSGYCASNDSVDCAVCKNTYHMNCVRPPLLKKPSRGFAWSCAACSRAQERKLEARHTPNMADPTGDYDEDELFDDEDEEMHGAGTHGTGSANDDDESHRTGTAEQVYQASLWPWRYLGMHCKPEDALDYDDRIYPRASTRVGPRHQATVLPWPGRPVEYMKPLEFKKNGKKDSKMSKEAQATYEAEKARREKLPKWFQDEPPGYVARGEDYDDDDDPNATASLLWRPPKGADGGGATEQQLDQYLTKAQRISSQFGLTPESTNFQDVAIQTYFHTGYSKERALEVLSETDKAEFREPELSALELKRFEEAVGKYGSELQLVTRHVKTAPYGTIARFYYVWKKTKQGKQIWGNFQNRKGKKEAKKAEAAASKLQDDIADDADDSAFDAGKASDKKKGFLCKFCHTKSSRQWRRAPNVANATLVTENGGKNAQKDKNNQYIQALCRRCAELWRRYAIQWEDLEEVAKKVAQSGNKAWKRKQDEELLKELLTANELITAYSTPEPAPQPPAATASSNGAPSGEPPRKKLKGLPPDRDSDHAASDTAPPPPPKKEKKVVEKPAPPPEPEIPKPKTMPCAVCGQLEPLGDQHLSCKECRMSVHRNCYGVVDNRPPGKWTCDMCMNDKNPQVSIHYQCVLCPIERTEHDFVEAPKVSTSSKKKSEKERERERLEREQAQKAADYYKKRQEEMNRPVNPREPLKRTADNNWVHVTCALWTPEVRFGASKALSPSEGISSIPRARYDEVCNACNQTGGACVACHHCKAPLHVECARQQGYLLGFDIMPVKGSRRDQHNIVTINGESGAMSAGIWCKDHVPTKTIVHQMQDIVNDSGQNALQLFAQTCKQADLTLTGTVRKANLITNSAKTSSTPITITNRRASTTTLPAAQSTANGSKGDSDSPSPSDAGARVCITCGIDTAPKWYRIADTDEKDLANGHRGGAETQKFIEQRKFQCHKCRKRRLKPNSHPPKERTPTRDNPLVPPLPLVQAQLAAPSLRSPPQLATSEPPRQGTSYPWGAAPPAIPATQHASPTGPHAPPLSAPSVQPPPGRPAAPHLSPSGPAMPLGMSGPRYPDWHAQPLPQAHGSPPRQMNGGPEPPPPPPSAPVQAAGALGNLSALRPPPMSLPPGTQMPSAVPNGQDAPPGRNGFSNPPGPVDHRSGMSPLAAYGFERTRPYATDYYGRREPHPPPGHMMPMDRTPSMRAPSFMPPRNSLSAPQGSPPAPAPVQMPRDGPLSREMGHQGQPSGTPNMRPGEPLPRPAGASTSPSLRNLLS